VCVESLMCIFRFSIGLKLCRVLLYGSSSFLVEVVLDVVVM